MRVACLLGVNNCSLLFTFLNFAVNLVFDASIPPYSWVCKTAGYDNIQCRAEKKYVTYQSRNVLHFMLKCYFKLSKKYENKDCNICQM